jgi:arylsulfatase A-like enzyme
VKRKQKLHSGLTRREALKYGLYGGLTGSLWVSSCRKPPVGERPNIILITIDTLRPDHLGCYGYHRNTSPNIDQFAQEALLFENCLSHSPSTWASCASILSGFLPHEVKLIAQFPVLPAGAKMLSRILRRQGYKTLGVVSNYVLSRVAGWGQGFMVYDDTMEERELVRRIPERTAGPTTNRVIELLKQFKKERLFMWIHYQDPHGPYTPPERLAKLFHDPEQRPLILKVNNSSSGYGGIPSYQQLGAHRDFYHYVNQYDSEIWYVDEQFAHLVDALKALEIYDNALIILTSDHGEGMGEHNHFFHHKENLYDSLTHVPLIIRYGNELISKRKDFVQHLDIVPTILKTLSLKADSYLRGSDLFKEGATKKEIFAEMKSKTPREDEVDCSIVLDGLKLIYLAALEGYELYDLKTDPHEEHNLINNPKYREKVEELKVRLNRIRNEDFLKLKPIKQKKFTDDELEKLKSLGYVQ